MYELNNLSDIKDYRRELRKNQTRAENVLWKRLRKKQLGHKFRRQHSFGKYIIDFYCPSLLLAIEVDESVHGEVSQRNRDKIRQNFLEHHLIKVIRFTNKQVIYELESVLVVTHDECEKRKKFLNRFTPSNSPLTGGEQ